MSWRSGLEHEHVSFYGDPSGTGTCGPGSLHQNKRDDAVPNATAGRSPRFARSKTIPLPRWRRSLVPIPSLNCGVDEPRLGCRSSLEQVLMPTITAG